MHQTQFPKVCRFVSSTYYSSLKHCIVQFVMQLSGRYTLLRSLSARVCFKFQWCQLTINLRQAGSYLIKGLMHQPVGSQSIKNTLENVPFLSSCDRVFNPCSYKHTYRLVATVKKRLLLPAIFLFYSSLERNYWISSPSPPLTLAYIYCHKTLRAFSLISKARPSHQQGFFPSAVMSLEMLTQHQASPKKHSPPSSEPRISVWPSLRLTSSSAALSRCRQSSGSVSYPRPAAWVCSWMETLQDCSKFTGTRSASVTQRRARKNPRRRMLAEL